MINFFVYKKMSESRRVLVRENEGCSQIVPLNRKKSLFSKEDVGPCDPSAPFGIAPGPDFKRPEPKVGINASSHALDYSMIRAIVREEVRSILREELSKMFENFNILLYVQ
jgi:hypothetical protein